MQELLKVAIVASLEAGKEIMKVYESGDFQTVVKSDNSPLTIADTKAHDVIFRHLKKTGILTLSEEGRDIPYDERRKEDTIWIVDPIDGTKEFIKKNGEFTVNVALVKDHIPVLGVIYVPAQETLYYSLSGMGAFKVAVTDGLDASWGDIVARSQKLPLRNANSRFAVVGSKSHMNEETYSFIDSLEKEHGPIDFVSKGSSLKLCMVAEGVADLYPRFAPTMEWDTAAGTAIILASGGTVINYETGMPLLYNREELLNPWFIARR